MERFGTAWLVANARSGSHSDAALETLHEDLYSAGIAIARTLFFPDEPVPEISVLDDAGVELIVVHAGDGTVNAALSALAGWSGAALVLPGGTMNLLSRRLHGDADVQTIVSCVGIGGASRARPKIARCAAGYAFAGLLAGPGTCWNKVREAMRSADLIGMIAGTSEAIGETTEGSAVAIADPRRGLEEGYPLVEICPTEFGLALSGYHAQDLGELAAQSWALLRRRFREGPHDRLGLGDVAVLGAAGTAGIEALLDGEPANLPSNARIELVECPVDLLATGPDA